MAKIIELCGAQQKMNSSGGCLEEGVAKSWFFPFRFPLNPLHQGQFTHM